MTGKNGSLMKKRIVLQWGQIVLGLLVFAFGVHLTIYANIGLAPWDCLGMGIARHTPLNYGLSMTALAVVILVICLLAIPKLSEKPKVYKGDGGKEYLIADYKAVTPNEAGKAYLSIRRANRRYNIYNWNDRHS